MAAALDLAATTAAACAASPLWIPGKANEPGGLPLAKPKKKYQITHLFPELIF